VFILSEIEKLEKQIPKGVLKRLQKEADLREYSDEEYLDFLKGYLQEQQISKEDASKCSRCKCVEG
jgi:hypothetical protein